MVDAYKSTKDKWRAFSYEKAIIAIKVRAKQSSEPKTFREEIHTYHNEPKLTMKLGYIFVVFHSLDLSSNQ